MCNHYAVLYTIKLIIKKRLNKRQKKKQVQIFIVGEWGKKERSIDQPHIGLHQGMVPDFAKAATQELISGSS